VSADRASLAATRLAAELEPTAHVHDGPSEYRVDVEAPGLDADDFQVRLAGRLLRVTGRDVRTPGSDSTFEFVFRLPDQVSGDGLAASFEDGRLIVRAPVHADEARTIAVHAGGEARAGSAAAPEPVGVAEVDEPVDGADHERPAGDVPQRHRQQIVEEEGVPGQP
jgi:HSP20 family molecular chaperone IbpA